VCVFLFFSFGEIWPKHVFVRCIHACILLHECLQICTRNQNKTTFFQTAMNSRNLTNSTIFSKSAPHVNLPFLWQFYRVKTAESTRTSVSEEGPSGTGPFTFSVQNEVLCSHLYKLPSTAPARLSFNKTNYWHSDFLTSSAFPKGSLFCPLLMALSDVCSHNLSHTHKYPRTIKRAVNDFHAAEHLWICYCNSALTV